MYSLTKELRQNEARNRSRIQNHQKHQARVAKLTQGNPVQHYRRMERLKKETLDGHGKKKLQQLTEDWQFMLKHKIHHEQIQELLASEKQKAEAAHKQRTKLHGRQLVYFNAELNPLGKVPEVEGQPMPNITIGPKRHRDNKPNPDARIHQWGITPPPGPRPQFYRKPVNTLYTIAPPSGT